MNYGKKSTVNELSNHNGVAARQRKRWISPTINVLSAEESQAGTRKSQAEGVHAGSTSLGAKS